MKIVDAFSVIEMMYLRSPVLGPAWTSEGTLWHGNWPRAFMEAAWRDWHQLRVWVRALWGKRLDSDSELCACISALFVLFVTVFVSSHVAAGLYTQMCSGSLGWIYCQAWLKHVWKTLASLSELITERDASCKLYKLLIHNYTSSALAIEALRLAFATLANSSGSMMAVLPGMKSKADIEKAWSTVDRNGAWVPMDSGMLRWGQVSSWWTSSHAKGLSILRNIVVWSCTILHVDNWGKPFPCMVETGQV